MSVASQTAETKHTPGPWRITGKATVRAGDDWIAKAHWRNAQANARLIAAAPDLLAVAVRMVAEADALAQSFGLERISETHDSLIAEARAAIAKAEGRS